MLKVKLDLNKLKERPCQDDTFVFITLKQVYWSECWGANIPIGVSSRKVLALRLAPWDTSSSATCIWKHNKQWRNALIVLEALCACALICFLLPVVFTLPDPSTLQHEEAATHLNLSGPCELPLQEEALQPARSRSLPRCGAAGAEEAQHSHLPSVHHRYNVGVSHYDYCLDA